MIMLRTDELKKWLKVTHKNQEWLAYHYGVRPSYISQIMNNRTHISGNFIAFILTKTQMPFEKLFYVSAEKENRAFYGKEILVGNNSMNSRNYYRFVDLKLKGVNSLDIHS
jgi:hypothetical protein